MVASNCSGEYGVTLTSERGDGMRRDGARDCLSQRPVGRSDTGGQVGMTGTAPERDY